MHDGDDVVLCYPDGRRIPVDWHFDQTTESGRHRRYIADVPPAATLDTGMVIQAGAVMVPVTLVSAAGAEPPTADDWVYGGSR